MVRKLNENMSRSQLIDTIDDIYSYDTDGKVDNALSKVLNVSVDKLGNYLDDSDPDEGFYNTMSNYEKIKDLGNIKKLNILAKIDLFFIGSILTNLCDWNYVFSNLNNKYKSIITNWIFKIYDSRDNTRCTFCF